MRASAPTPAALSLSHLWPRVFRTRARVLYLSVNTMQTQCTLLGSGIKSTSRGRPSVRLALPSAIICWVHARRRRGERDRTRQCMEMESLQVQEARRFRNL
jgi:hypothetical protein